jgi:hypothetical protein
MYIQMSFPDGTNHTIHSRNPETLGRWIIETYAELAFCGWDQYKYPPRIMVYPSFNPESRHSDWVADTTILGYGINDAHSYEEFYRELGKQLTSYQHKLDGDP